MKKGILIALILGTVGGLAGSIGMCMWLLPEWNMQSPGAVLGAIGAFILLLIWPIYRKAENKGPLNLPGTTKGMILLGVLGAIALVIGVIMCFVPAIGMMTQGIVFGAIGTLLMLAIIPIYRKAAGKRKIIVNPKYALAAIIGILGTFGLGIGMSLIMVGGSSYLLTGMVVGVIGLLLCIANYPIFAMRKAR